MGRTSELSSAPLSLTARGLTKAYRGRAVIRGLDLDLRAGVIAGGVGENGSGKTTLVRLLAGTLAPDTGTIAIGGTLGYCPQEALLFRDLTVQEHFRYFAAAYGVTGWRLAMDLWLDRLGFRDHARERVDRLSGGTRQKLNLAMALLHAPDVLLLDEPYAAFDWKTYSSFWEVMAELRRDGRTVLMVSPLVHDLERFDTVYELSEGILR
jgi:ABC-type multidrug transport system ATPase subunit